MTKFEVRKDSLGWAVDRLVDDTLKRFTPDVFPTCEAAVLWLIHQQHDEYFEIGVGAE